MDFSSYMSEVEEICQVEFGRSANDISSTANWRRCYNDRLYPEEAFDRIVGNSPSFGFLKADE